MQTTRRLKGLVLARAKVIRKNGEVEYSYSVPQVPAWNIRDRLWLRRRLRAMKREDKGA